MGYKQLDYKKRCQIYGLWSAGYRQTEIAKELGVHKSTISRELNRNITFVRTKLGSWQYKPNYAQGYANERHKKKPKYIKFTVQVETFVREKLQKNWSPDQISGFAKRHNLFSISHEWIYQFVLKDKEKGGKLYLHLRHQKKYRKRYETPNRRQGPIKNRRFIDERPAIVDDKKRIGDWEIDTIIGKNRKHAIVSIVERFSKKTILKKIEAKTAELTSQATITAFFYFAHPYSSWERGLNENTNGLVRQYLKKGSSFADISNKCLELIADNLNNRPRKSLGYATPNESFSWTNRLT